MARKARTNLTGLFIAIPPDKRPVGPLTSDHLPYGQGERTGPMRSDYARGGQIFCSDVMEANNCVGADAPWANGIRTVSNWELSLQQRNPIRESRGEEEK